MDQAYQYPHLIENSAKNYLFNTLKQCHSNRVSVYYYILNISVLVLFLGIFGMVLYNCNKEKLSDFEKQQKMIKDQQYVLSKIRYFKEEYNNMKNTSVSDITNLPFINVRQ
jgi:hypothetical protein